MLDKISIIKKKLMESMSQLCEVSWMFIKDPKRDPTVFYKLPFRIARFQIADGVYKTVVTNLDRCKFPALELKQLYNMRWGIETSFGN